MGIRDEVSILVVEDDEFTCAVTIAMLRALGYPNVMKAVNGAEAVRACTETQFDLIVMDCDMPVMNGWDATRAIRALGVRTPIVGYSASVASKNISRCAEVGMDDFLAKPASPSQLALKLKQWLA
jgi:CheY-like chemotaxis protein